MSIEDIRSPKGLCLLEALEVFEKVSELETKLEDAAKQLQYASSALSHFNKGENMNFPEAYRALSENTFSLTQRMTTARQQLQQAIAKARQLGIKDVSLLRK